MERSIAGEAGAEPTGGATRVKVPIGNRMVGWTLRSPLHRLLDGKSCAVRWVGRRTGRTFTTPVQYARHDRDIVIVAGRADTKTWWRNFRHPHPADLLVDRHWTPVEIHVAGPDELAPAASAVKKRFHRDVAGSDVVLIARPR